MNVKLTPLNENCYKPKCHVLGSYFVIFFKLVIQTAILVSRHKVWGVQVMQSGYIPQVRPI